MIINKIGHSCFVIEHKGVRILFDPGYLTQEQNEVTGLDLIIITHAHKDHLDVESLKQIHGHNPQATIITNQDAGNVVETASLRYERIEDGGSFVHKGIRVEAFGSNHEPIYPGVPIVVNTGYLIDRILYQPGDAYTILPFAVPVLALPVGAPWGTIGQSIDYAKAMRPRICFPIHDGMLKTVEVFHRLPKMFLGPMGIDFKPLESNQQLTIDL